MEQDVKKRPVISFIISLGFIAVSINGLFKGIDQHNTWRIAAATVGGLIFLSFAVMLIYVTYKNGKAVPKA